MMTKKRGEEEITLWETICSLGLFVAVARSAYVCVCFHHLPLLFPGGWEGQSEAAVVGPSPIINIKKEKRETEEETKEILRSLERDNVRQLSPGQYVCVCVCKLLLT